jgi:hypothetical protein
VPLARLRKAGMLPATVRVDKPVGRIPLVTGFLIGIGVKACNFENFTSQISVPRVALTALMGVIGRPHIRVTPDFAMASPLPVYAPPWAYMF